MNLIQAICILSISSLGLCQRNRGNPFLSPSERLTPPYPGKLQEDRYYASTKSERLTAPDEETQPKKVEPAKTKTSEDQENDSFDSRNSHLDRTSFEEETEDLFANLENEVRSDLQEAEEDVFVPRSTRQTSRPRSRAIFRRQIEDRSDLDYDDEPRYNYRYDINDPETQDIKMHQEMRDGDYTAGKYSLVEPDGSVREVEYVVHGDAGYNAVVRNKGKETYHGPLARELFQGKRPGSSSGGSGGRPGRPGRPSSSSGGRRPGSSGRPSRPGSRPGSSSSRPNRPSGTYGVPLAPALGPDDRPGYAGRR